MSASPPAKAPRKQPIRRVSSLLLVNTGNGKGKSTAAFGTMIRAVARGWNVSVIQFIKSGKWKVGEEEVGRRLGVDWWTTGDGFTWNSKDMDETEARAREAWHIATDRLASGEYELVVLDEITYAVNYGWIELGEILTALKQRAEKVNVIITGRDAPKEIIEIADTVTEMKNIKHAFDQGVPAKRGIDL